MKHKSFCIILPSLNPMIFWEQWITAVNSQSILADEIINIDSSSDDGFENLTVELKQRKIERRDFNHGGSRNLGVSLTIDSTEIIVFMTQDAILYNSKSLASLIAAFDDPSVGAAFGRQLPHDNANLIATHARLFNYPETTSVKSIADKDIYGIKCAFISNSFAAYRKDVFEALGGFSDKLILAEDMHLAARMLLQGYNIAYVADATVKHSHNYTIGEEFRRYFDIGVFHHNEDWIMNTFGSAHGEGARFVRSEIAFLFKHKSFLIFKAPFYTLAKYLGYQLGRHYKKLPRNLCKYFSMTKSYWK